MALIDSWWLSLLITFAIFLACFLILQKLALPWPVHAIIGISSLVAGICLNHSTLWLGQHIEWRIALSGALIGLTAGELSSTFKAYKPSQG
jgi:hypothetical protein